MAVQPRGTKGLYERLLEERAEEEQHRGRFLGDVYGLDSTFLDRRRNNAPPNRSDHKADLYKLYGFLKNGVHSRGSAMRFASLKRKYPEEYGQMRAEHMGQGEIF